MRWIVRLWIEVFAAKGAKEEPPCAHRTARAEAKAQCRESCRRLLRTVWRCHVWAKLDEHGERSHSPQRDEKRQEADAPPLLGEQVVKHCKQAYHRPQDHKHCEE